MKSKWLILIIMVVIVLINQNVKKESRFGFRCAEDKSSIEVYRKESDKFTTYEMCDGECELIDGIPICVSEEIEKEEEIKKGIPMSNLLIAMLIFIFILWRRNKGG